MSENMQYNAGVYLRLSKDDELQGESFSIGTQRAIIADYCAQRQFHICREYIDDGFSGMNFNRPDFQKLLDDIDAGAINMVITKDLSRLGRDYIMTGYYSEIYFPSKGVRYIAVTDNFDSAKSDNDIAPFRNILNDMYARDLSRKIRAAKHQIAKQGLFIGSQAPYGYKKSPDNKNRLIVDPEAAEVVRLVFSLAEGGLGNIAIASELKARGIITPSVYKYQHGDRRFARCAAIKNGDFYEWNYGTIGQILNNRVYLGELISLKTETINCKTKQRATSPIGKQIITQNAHTAIISQEQFDRIPKIRAGHNCPTYARRFNMFRGLLYCECCGHPLTISRKQLLNRVADIYLCNYHYKHPEVCPKTHRVYHEMLYPYVLQQTIAFARTIKRRKVNSPIKSYTDITELTPEILNTAIERIEIGHVRYNSRPGNVIHIYWKLK